ncbi:MAG: DUF2065 domain-containing protein [Emcibacteraceae bacterium]|nr:DUF2065 domain-containing protein [Emcibacteraceae bacterium]MDG1995333.1 DUF2065 domain-containing protein [Emcibacteraceae bacterium]
MIDFIVAIGMVLVIEGILYALFPVSMRNMIKMALELPEKKLRQAGLIAAIIGVALIYFIK